MTTDGCVLCRRAESLDAAEPGWLLRTGTWGVSMHPAMPVPGWIAVQTLRHTEGLGDLNHAEAAELGPLLSQLSTAVTKATSSERVYAYSLGEGCPHTHILLGPPQQQLRGAAFITGLLGRDESLTDQAAALRVAVELADQLADQPAGQPAGQPSGRPPSSPSSRD
jgi:diadenosine tetraphosphate (Ap4A) HIT family hydrolase